jgi:glycosyltransferase involved in cell wall biosynthesis
MTDQNNNSLVSVIIPCYNHGQFLRETLTSVLNQTYANWECIMVDNDSNDNTKEIANEFVKSDNRFRYFHQSNSGVSSARNVAVSKSKGKYILPLDSDDKIGPGYIMDAIAILDSKPDVKIVYCEAELFGEASGKWNLPAFSMKTMLMENCIFCTALYRQIDFDKSGGYNELMKTGFEDWDFWLRLLKDGGKVEIIPKTYFYYRIRKSSRNNSLNINAIKNLRKTIYENHRDLYSKHLDIPEIIFEWYIQKEASRKIQSSREWLVGKGILMPLRKLQSLFKKES